MENSQFVELLERLGRTTEDSVTICYQSEVQRFTAKTIKVDLAESTIQALDSLNNNIWYEINPSQAFGRAKADDIQQLAALYIDIDYKDGGAGSVAKARELVELLSDLIGVGPSAVVYSGHGIQPYWAIDPEEDFDATMAQGILNRWGAFARFVGGAIGVELDSVFDLARIFRVPGSRNLKDSANPVDVFATFPADWRPLSINEINDVLIAHGITSENNMPDGFELVSSASEWKHAEHDCQFTPTLFGGLRENNKPPKSRHGWLLQQLVTMNSGLRNGCLTRETHHEMYRLIEERFAQYLQLAPKRPMNPNEVSSANKWAVARVESFDATKLAMELRSHQHSDFGDGNPTSVLGEPSGNAEYSRAELADIYEATFSTYGRTDAANSRRFIYFAQGDYKFIPDVGWHRWDGTRYVFDKEKAVWQTVVEAAQFCEFAGATGDQLKWATQSANKDRVLNCLAIAGTDPDVLVSAIEMDAQPNDLCTPAGIVNLLTGEIRPAKKAEDLNTRSTAVPLKRIATPMWNEFLKTVIQDEDRIGYLQELLGASLYGDSRYHVLPVLAGTGANGKSTLLDVVSGILGDYAASMPENFLLDTSASTHPTEIARLRGVRFAMASETRPDGKFNESRVKMLTGGDMLSARFMNQNFFDFRPTHTLFLAVNHLPAVKSGGDGFWRRLRKMDFKVTIPKDEQRENFAQSMIEEEGPGILQWMIDGAVRVTNQGFSEPESVKLATLEYRHEEDHIAKFIDERIVLASNGTATKTAVFNSYRDWCIENGEKPITQNALNREVRHRLNSQETTVGGARIFTGIELLNVVMQPDRLVDEKETDEYWR